MNLHRLLLERNKNNNPIKVGLIGAGKFGTMFLSQARTTTGIHIVGIADLNVEQAKKNCLKSGWKQEKFEAGSYEEALAKGKTFIGEDSERLIKTHGIEVIVEATGNPTTGISHCLQCIENGVHIVMVNVEADVLAGPLLASKALKAGVCYSLAYGDQPALICEHVDWARAIGFEVTCAGKGTRYLPSYHESTPDTVWENFGWDLEVVRRGGLNPKMFNSFIDGTKSGIEMTAVCNATGLTPQSDGLSFPPASRFELADICKPKEFGGKVEKSGTTEVVSSLQRDGTSVPNHLQVGTYVVVEADTDYVKYCFEEYTMLPDQSFRFAALYRPIHLIGLELGISIASTVLRNEPTGSPLGFQSDVVTTAKKKLHQGEILDGEGGYCVWGRQMPAIESIKAGCLPLGLANEVKLNRDVSAGEQICWKDVEIDMNQQAVKIRREMENLFS